MAAVVYIDRIDNLEMEEQFGATVRLLRKFTIVGLEDTAHEILQEALAEAGVPVYGDGISGTGYENVFVTNRQVRAIDKDKAEVVVTYEHFLEGQDIDKLPFGLLLGQVNATLQQTSSNLDENGNVILLSHTYDSEDPDFPDETKEQGGQIEYFQSQITLNYQAIKQVSYPWQLVRGLTGRINSRSWSGSAKHTWMCTSASFKPYDVNPPGGAAHYLFSFEFQYNVDTWNPTVVFIDERTGKPPKDLVADTGFLTVRKHPEIDFEAALGVRVQGG